MRINKFIANATGLSRRTADQYLQQGRVLVNNAPPTPGQQISPADTVTLDGKSLGNTVPKTTILLNKPAGYVCSRNGQGSQTIYDLLPKELHHLKPIGRLDKDSSGLLLLTNDGDLAHQLTHPSFQKRKIYEITLNTALTPLHQQMISDYGIQLDDGPSKLQLTKLNEARTAWQVVMHEGRNRQIRRTFAALGYSVSKLHRTQFGPYQLHALATGTFQVT
jgi:23S rRNA pseudouridine2605 synthase